MPRLLASPISRPPHSRTWLTLPGRRFEIAEVHGLDRVDDQRPRLARRHVGLDRLELRLGQDEELRRRQPEPVARASLTCAADSSPDT